jgi:iron complex transport system substrate-binding protein
MMVCFLVIGCVGAAEQKSGPETSFKDLAGNNVTLPKSVDRVIITSMSPMVPVYIWYMDGTDKLIGANSAGITYALGGPMSKMYKLKGIETGYVKGVVINIEEILKLKPDVVIYTGSRQDEYKLLSDAGLTAVGFPVSLEKWNYDVFIHMENWLNQLSQLIGGDTARKDKLIKYNNDVQKKVADRLKDVNDDKKPRALFISTFKEGTLQVAGNKSYGDWWIETSGAKNVANELTGTKDVDIEQIIAWDPEIIYLGNSQNSMPTDMYLNTIPGYDWKPVTAVKNKQVYVLPYTTYMTQAPSLEAGVVLQWMAQKNQPELFKDIDINKEFESFYKDIFGYTTTEEDIKGFLNPKYIPVRLH